MSTIDELGVVFGFLTIEQQCKIRRVSRFWSEALAVGVTSITIGHRRAASFLEHHDQLKALIEAFPNVTLLQFTASRVTTRPILNSALLVMAGPPPREGKAEGEAEAEGDEEQEEGGWDLRSISLRGQAELNDDTLKALSRFTNLEVLNLTNTPNATFTPAGLAACFEKLGPSLTALSLTEAPPRAAPGLLPLTRLEDLQIMHTTEEDVEALTTIMPQLKRFYLGMSRLEPADLQKLAKVSKNLEQLELYLTRVDPMALEAFAQSCKFLTSLAVPNSQLLVTRTDTSTVVEPEIAAQPPAQRAALMHGKMLEQLKASVAFSRVPVERRALGIGAIIAGGQWKQLRNVNLSSTLITETDFRAIADNVKSLVTLNVSKCNLSEDALMSLHQHCHTLEEIAVSRVDVTDRFLANVVAECPKLKALRIAYCRLVTHVGIEAVARGCPNLVSLVCDAPPTSVEPGSAEAQEERRIPNRPQEPMFTSAVLDVLWSSCPRLEILTMARQHQVREGLARAQGRLMRLHATQCHVDDAICQRLGEKCPLLEELSFREAPDVTRRGLEALAALPNLRLVDFVYSSSQWHGLRVLVKESKSLQEVNIGHLSDLTVFQWEELGRLNRNVVVKPVPHAHIDMIDLRESNPHFFT